MHYKLYIHCSNFKDMFPRFERGTSRNDDDEGPLGVDLATGKQIPRSPGNVEYKTNHLSTPPKIPKMQNNKLVECTIPYQ